MWSLFLQLRFGFSLSWSRIIVAFDRQVCICFSNLFQHVPLNSRCNQSISCFINTLCAWEIVNLSGKSRNVIICIHFHLRMFKKKRKVFCIIQVRAKNRKVSIANNYNKLRKRFQMMNDNDLDINRSWFNARRRSAGLFSFKLY